MLSPLTDLVRECGHTKATKANTHKHKPWHWDEVNQTVFDNIKTTISKDVVLACPDYSQDFGMYTYSSNFQLGAVITQNNRLMAFFSRKLNKAQQKYRMTKQELLTTAETLVEFKGMLWDQCITVYTDHKTLTQDALGLTSDLVQHWRLLLEEYDPTILYLKGIHNTLADAISRLDNGPIKNSRKTWMTFTKC